MPEDRISGSPGRAGRLGSGEVRPSSLAKGVTMATGPRFPWRFHALAGSQREKCFGTEAGREQ